MATLESRIISAVQAIGTDIKALNDTRGVLSSLTTTAKGNLVAAINEINAALGAAGAAINDSVGDGATTTTWSADKIFDEIAAAKVAVTNSLVNGAASALDTLSELATALGNDPSFATTIATGLANRVRYDAAQTLTAPQQAQARSNIGALSTVEIGNPDADLVAAYNTAKS